MRVLGLALAGMIALSALTVAHAVPLGLNIEAVSTGSGPGVIQVREGSGSGSGGGHAAPGHLRQWQGGWVRPHWGPNRYYSGPGPNGGWGGPVYWVWGNGGGAWDYPFADWRGPDGGWGNP